MTIISPIEEVKTALPELQSISNYNNTKYISYQSWNNRIKSIETKNLKKYGKSISFASMVNYFKPCILEIQSDTQTILINQEQYKLIRNYLMSPEFILR